MAGGSGKRGASATAASAGGGAKGTRTSGGRTTPKGTRPDGSKGPKGSKGSPSGKGSDESKGRRRQRGGSEAEPRQGHVHHQQLGHRRKGTRYTAPIPKSTKKSPRWVGWLIIALFLVGVVLIILNYADLLPGGVNNWWLVGAIGSIFAGLIVATTYR